MSEPSEKAREGDETWNGETVKDMLARIIDEEYEAVGLSDGRSKERWFPAYNAADRILAALEDRQEAVADDQMPDPYGWVACDDSMEPGYGNAVKPDQDAWDAPVYTHQQVTRLLRDRHPPSEAEAGEVLAEGYAHRSEIKDAREGPPWLPFGLQFIVWHDKANDFYEPIQIIRDTSREERDAD